MLIEIQLDNPKSRVAFVGAITALVSLLVALTIRSAIIASLAESTNTATVESALRFDPANERLLNQLGLLYLWGDLDPAKALPVLQRAVALNPVNPQYRENLGSICDALSDRHCADSAYLSASTLAPVTPKFRLSLAHHYLVTSRNAESLQALHRYFELKPDHPEDEFALYLRAIGDPDPLWRALPQTSKSQLQFAFINFLSQSGNLEAANHYWKQLAEQNARPDLQAVSFYLNALAGKSQWSQLAQVWTDLSKAGIVSPRDSNNLIFNGGFEHDPTNLGLDWQFQPQKYVSLDFSDHAAHRGTRALRIDFTSRSNADFQLLQQIVPVAPDHQYEIAAFMRSADLTSDSGPLLRLQDAICSDCLDVMTSSTAGTTPWHEVRSAFTTGPQTCFLRLSLWRPRSRSYPSEITGQFWIDDIRLTPLP